MRFEAKVIAKSDKKYWGASWTGKLHAENLKDAQKEALTHCPKHLQQNKSDWVEVDKNEWRKENSRSLVTVIRKGYRL